jgi:very-short-patch-repair endonuclease
VDRDPVQVVRLAGGRAPAAGILAGCTRRRLYEAVRSGRLVRARRGVYALPALPNALALAAELGGVVSHASAADLMGVGLVRRPEVVHVTVPRGARSHSHPGARIHWTRQLPLDDVDQGLTVPLRALLDCASSMPFAEALAIADGMLAMRYVREEQLLTAAHASCGRGRAARIRVAEAADRRAENPFESVVRAIVIESGVGGFVPQVEIRLPGRLIRVDLADVDRRIVLEADSFEHHGTRVALVRDCGRYNDLVAAGWLVLRLPWEDVMLRPDRVRRIVTETCALVDARRAARRTNPGARRG